MNEKTIGERAYEECIRIWGTPTEAANALGENGRIAIQRWKTKVNPGAYYLKELLLAGADLKYILIGERSHELP